MKPFKVESPKTVDEAVALLADTSRYAAILAGGTELMPGLKSMRSPKSPDVLVNLKTIENDLTYIKEEDGMLKIGALATLTKIAKDPIVNDKYKALAQAAKAVGSPELRNMGTIGGNICQKLQCWYFCAEDNLFPCLRKEGGNRVCYAIDGDNRYHSIFGSAGGGCYAVNPSDTAAALMALKATVITSKKKHAIADFFDAEDENTTVLDADEIVTEIQVPSLGNAKSAFRKFALRKSFDFPIVNCAAVISQESGTVSAASIALNAVYNLPRKATDAEDAIIGKAINDSNAEAAGAAAVSKAEAMKVPSHGKTTCTGNKYMIQIAKVLVKRTISDCK